MSGPTHYPDHFARRYVPLSSGVVALTAGRMPYVGADGGLKDEAGFTYDENTNSLGVSAIVASNISSSSISADSITADDIEAANTLTANGTFSHAGTLFGAFGVTPATRPGATAEIKAGLASLGLLTDGGATPLNLDGGALSGVSTAALSSYIEQDEIADPAAPAANKARLYIRDVGGKSQLAVRFPSGRIMAIAEEPTTVQTTDATVTTLKTYTPTDQRTTVYTVLITAIKSDFSGGASYWRRFTVRRNGGTVTAISTVEVIGSDDEDTAGWDATLDISGSTVRVRVTGAAATTLNWSCDEWVSENA